MANIERINELLLEELAQAVNREVLVEDALITITSVQCAPDFQQAIISFSVLPDHLVGTALRRLTAATSQLVAILKKRTRLRKIPHLIWEFDATEKEAAKIEKLIAGIED